MQRTLTMNFFIIGNLSCLVTVAAQEALTRRECFTYAATIGSIASFAAASNYLAYPHPATLFYFPCVIGSFVGIGAHELLKRNIFNRAECAKYNKILFLMACSTWICSALSKQLGLSDASVLLSGQIGLIVGSILGLDFYYDGHIYHHT